MSATKPPTFWLNTHTSDPEACATFFTALGLEQVTDFSDAETKSFRLPAPNDNVCAMFHGHTRFKQFIRPDTHVSDAFKCTETLLAISLETKKEVDSWVNKAVAAGGSPDPYKMEQSPPGMYGRSFADLDGHIWEVLTFL